MSTKLALLCTVLSLAWALSCSPKVYIKSARYVNYKHEAQDSIFVQAQPNAANAQLEGIIKHELSEKGYIIASLPENASYILQYQGKKNQHLDAQKIFHIPAADAHKRIYPLQDDQFANLSGDLNTLRLTLYHAQNLAQSSLIKMWQGLAAVSDDWYQNNIQTIVRLLLDYLGFDFDDSVPLD